MSQLIDSVNSRTQLVGQNRLELLLFNLGGRQLYGINVFKVREVLRTPKLVKMPRTKECVIGVAHVRGQSISVIDLSLATKGRPIKDVDNAFVIISEYNGSVQGFLVSNVERIINLNWDQVTAPPEGMGQANYLTAVTQHEDKLVEIIDVEQILSRLMAIENQLSADVQDKINQQGALDFSHVMVVDDSSVARKQVCRALSGFDFEIILANNGQQAWQKLQLLAEQNENLSSTLPLVISDIEMPEMDGYTLTSKIKQHESLKHLKVILHTSLSGVFNHALVGQVGADNFIAKFDPDTLANAVTEVLQEN
ncbi:chemotaxis protein CheV [Paraferrimonas sp. SM1919]|uniref:chemotaxis protein CheV n=1 Tax=Paraferrimonas sp. SM1919 TaxID=2662263 RepID=UPI0013D4A74F|nr:chemotaxis protein CheV [Paraferrimonas sp. SM1919]